MTEIFWFVAIITAFWFPVYWFVGGVFFAVMALFRMTKMRKARFSCLFTITSMVTAISASYGGIRLGEGQVKACAEPNLNFLDTLSSVIGCGVLELTIAGLIGFGALIMIGLFLMLITRAGNQSWIDSNMGLDKEEELTFDNI